MDEKTKTIIDRARALLAAATPGPWEVCPDTRPDVRTTCNTGGFLGCGHIATVSRYDANEADAALIAAAPGLLAAICDALESAERRAEEAEDERELLKQMLPPGAGVVAATIGEMTRKCETLQAENEDLTAELNRACVELTASDEAFESQARQYAAIRDEIDALRAEGFSMSAEIVAAERDALKRRAEEAEAQAGVGRVAIRSLMEDHDPDTYSRCQDRECDHVWLAMSALADGAGRALLDRLHAAEAKVARMEARKAAICGCVSCCSGHVAPDIEDACPDCHGSGAVIVEGGE